MLNASQTQEKNVQGTIQPRKEYIKWRLKEWGAWESGGNSIKFLGYQSFLGKLVNARTGGVVHGPNNDECEEVHFAFIKLKEHCPFSAECIYQHYSQKKEIGEAARFKRINRDTYSKYLSNGENFIAGALM